MKKEKGIVLVSTLFLIVALLAMIAAYSIISQIELATTKATSNSAEGFYAAEAGLNIRAEEVRQTFLGYNRPTGTSPNEVDACLNGNNGIGHFQCKTITIGNHTVYSYILEEPSNPLNLTIPQGELFQNLNAQEYRYTVRSRSVNLSDNVEAMLDLKFKSRLVPLFQFMAFYNKDLEILPGPAMTMNGPVHTNGDLYLNSDNTLSATGQISTAGQLFRGRKNTSACNGTVRVRDPVTFRNLNSPCTSRTSIQSTAVGLWNGMIRIGVDELTVPEPEILDPVEGNSYWELADLRLVLRLGASNIPNTTNSSTAVEIRHADHTVNVSATSYMNSCVGNISGRVANNSNSFYNNREAKTIRMLEIDMIGLLNCIQNSVTAGGGNNLLAGKNLNDASEGGLVFHLSVDGNDSNATANNYGVRVRNAANLQSNIGGAGIVRGLTLITDQAFYVGGNFNSTEPREPAAIMSDSFNVLSSSWNYNDNSSTASMSTRNAGNTTIQAAILSGTDTTGGIEGIGGQGGSYNGGLENYPRFHENWNGDTFTYRGSFVSLNNPRHVNGAWIYGAPQYNAPNRTWSYDTNFNNAANLPPLSPRFVYLRQELFVRDFEQ